MLPIPKNELGAPLMGHRNTIVNAVTNPFSNAAPWTSYEKFKLVLCGCTLFPVRLILILITFLIHVMLCALASAGVKLTNDRGTLYVKEAFPLWRRIILSPTVVTTRMLLLCLGYWHIRVTDNRKDKSVCPKLIVVAPHKTFVDPFMISVAFPPMPAGVGKKELLHIPLLKYVGRASQGIYVDRKNDDSKHSCKEVIAAHGRADWAGPPTLIFPEGTTTNGKALIQFKLGPFSPGEPVLPVLLKYPFKHFDPSWCGHNENLGVAILRCMLQFANFCEIVIQEPYIPNDEEKKNPILFAGNVRKQMAAYLQVGTTEHSYDDLFLSASATKASVNQDFVIKDIKGKYDLNLDQLKTVLKQFQKLDTSKSGTLSHAEFAKALRATDGCLLSDDATIAHIFTFFDSDGTGEICYPGTGRVPVASLQRALDNPLKHGGAWKPQNDGPTLGARIVQAAGGLTELDFQSFCALVEKEPDVIEDAMSMMRARFGLEELVGSRRTIVVPQ